MGEWSFAPGSRLFELKAAKAWGLTPSEFYALSREDQNDILAVEWIEGDMQAVEAYEMEKEMEKHRPKKKK